MAYPVVDDLIIYMMDSGVPHKVTSTFRPGGRSWHSQGLAVDFAGPSPGVLTLALRAVYEALLPLAPECLELIYHDQGWKNGQPFRYSPTLQRQHQNHVHIAMPVTWRWEPIPVAPAPEERRWPVSQLSPRSWRSFRRPAARATGS